MIKSILLSVVSLIFLTRLLAATVALGNTYPIVEEDVLQWIERKLMQLQKNNTLEKLNQSLQQKMLQSIATPNPVSTVSKTVKARQFKYDPTLILAHDILDEEGHILIKAGTKVNPFDSLALSHHLLIFDGDDVTQIAWAKRMEQRKKPTHWILVNGNWKQLQEQFQRKIFFDQGGFLTRQLNIQHVPALVYQEAKHLMIEEQVP